jgi:hypothetical protein
MISTSDASLCNSIVSSMRRHERHVTISVEPATNPTGSVLKVRDSKFGAIGAQSRSGGHTRQRTTAVRQTFHRLRLTCRRDPAPGSLLRHIAHLRCMETLTSPPVPWVPLGSCSRQYGYRCAVLSSPAAWVWYGEPALPVMAHRRRQQEGKLPRAYESTASAIFLMRHALVILVA